MVAKIIDEMGNNPPQEISALIKLLSVVPQEDAYRDLINEGLRNHKNFNQRKKLLDTGAFSIEDYTSLLLTCVDGPGGLGLYSTMPLFNRLIEWGMVVEYPLSDPRTMVHYYWEKNKIKSLINLGIVDNILLGPSYVARKYHKSVPPVYVKQKGCEYIGTGFIASSMENIDRRFIVTAKHNINPDEGIEFLGLGDSAEKIIKPCDRTWILHPKLDLALLEVECDNTITPIFPLGDLAVLMRTITLGYPRIATTDAPYLLAHGGELNALVNTYLGEDRLIISNVVAPGNSGGPVLGETGLCLGVVVNSLESHHEGGIEKANSAIPANHVLDFINLHCSG